MKKLFATGVLAMCAFVFETNAQYAADALLFGRTTYNGTARMQGLGGAPVSLGGDISAALINPAGLGFYNRSEVTFSPGILIQKSDSRFNNQVNTTEIYSGNFDVGNLGMVLHSGKRGSEFKGMTFAISLDKINDFNGEFQYCGNNDNNSFLFTLAQNAFNIDPDNLGELEYGAYQTSLINPIAVGNVLEYDPVNLTNVVKIDGEDRFFHSYPKQEETVRTNGGQYQFSLSGGANYNDKVYFGATLGVPFLNYRQDKFYRESEFFIFGDNVNVFNGPDEAFDGFTLQEDLRISGIGVNGTLGLIVRPVNNITVGISYISPTIYSMDAQNTFTFTSRFNSTIRTFGGDTITAGEKRYTSPRLVSEYTLVTPSKLNIGSSLFLGKLGFLTGSVEFVNYSNASVQSSDFSTTEDNNNIKNTYKSAVNFRGGGELRLDNLRLRAGFVLQPNPFEPGFEEISARSINFGVGYRKKEYYLDMGVINTSSNSLYQPYSLKDGQPPVVESDHNSTKVVFTVGFNF